MSNSTKLKGKLRAYLLKDTRKYVEILGPIMVTYLKNKLGVPVEGSGLNAIRSHEGEYPRKETESLQESIDYKVEKRGNRIVLIFGSLNDTRQNGKKTNPTLYARYLAGRFKRKLARSAWDDAVRSGALRKALNRRRVPYRKDISASIMTPGVGRGSNAHAQTLGSGKGT